MDGYIAECERDVGIVRRLGFAGLAFEPTPASGGQEFGTLPKLDDLPSPSRRELILIKGYHGWAGRGLHILSAVHLVAPALRRFKIRTLFTSPAIKETSAMLAAQDGLDIAPARHLAGHAEALARVGQARMVVSMGVSDGISTTLLEAVSLGGIPSQGDTSCACEWIENGRDGFILNPHDVAGLGRAIVRAAEDDALVDTAALRNREVVEQRWNVAVNGERALGYYRTMLRSGGRAAPQTSPLS